MIREPVSVRGNKGRLLYPLLLIFLIAGVLLVVSFLTKVMSVPVILAVGAVLMAAEIIVAIRYQRYLSGLQFPGRVEDGYTPWVLDVAANRQDEELRELTSNLREDGEIELLFSGRLDTEKAIDGSLHLDEQAPSLREPLIRLLDPATPEDEKLEALNSIKQWLAENREQLLPLPPETE